MCERENKILSIGRHRFLITGILCLFGICLLGAQEQKQQIDKRKRVDLLYADEAQADKRRRPDVQVLVGSVRLRHDSMAELRSSGTKKN